MERFLLLPIQYPDIWQLYKECLSSFWTVDEVNLEKDVQQYRHVLSWEEKNLLDATLGFFACADGIVSENLASRFLIEVTMPEARAFYANQILMETIHAEMYSIIIDQICPTVEEKTGLFRSFENNANIKEKADYALKYITSNKSFATRLLGFLVVEGIFFSASFASIFWFKQRGLVTKPPTASAVSRSTLPWMKSSLKRKPISSSPRGLLLKSASVGVRLPAAWRAWTMPPWPGTLISWPTTGWRP